MNNETAVEWVLANRLSEATGLSLKAIERKRQRGVWVQGINYRMMDGRFYYSIPAYNQWVSARTTQVSRNTEENSVSFSSTRAHAAAKR